MATCGRCGETTSEGKTRSWHHHAHHYTQRSRICAACVSEVDAETMMRAIERTTKLWSQLHAAQRTMMKLHARMHGDSAAVAAFERISGRNWRADVFAWFGDLGA